MIFVLACCVAACFGVSVYLLLSREMKGVAMGVFLLSHGANLAILAVSGSPVIHAPDGDGYSIKRPPVSGYALDAELRAGEVPAALGVMVNPLPQALILTAIVIGFAVMGLTLTLLVVTSRAAGSMSVAELAAMKTGAAGDADGPGLDGGLGGPGMDGGLDGLGTAGGLASAPGPATRADATGGGTRV